MDETTSPSLAAEALLATSGLFQVEALSPADGKLARALPKTWRAAVVQFLDQRKPPPFRLPKRPDHQDILDRLNLGVDAARRATLVARLTDPDIGAAYIEVLARAYDHLRQRWPALAQDTPVGPRPLPPGRTEQWRAASLLAVVDDPDRVLDEMRMGTLTSDQTETFRATYPELFRMLKGIIWDELTRRYKDPEDYALPWRKEQVIRVLVGLPPEVALTRREAQAPTKQQAAPDIKVDFQALRSRAQELAAPRT